MASPAANSPTRARAVTPASESSVQHSQFIEFQLARTRRRVKLVDLGGAIMGLVGGMVLFLLGIVLIDHWLLDLNAWQRFAALAILVLGAAYYCARLVIPLLVRRINPTYAARAIEQSDPSLKNSLINLLMFRRDNTPTSRLVHRALRERAAEDLRTVNIDLAVDRTRLIYIGYTVVALMVLFAAYTILSPKDVFQSVRRIAVPWANIARPTRVTISEVDPGDTPVILGKQTDVSAKILGISENDTVTLYYSTEDQQIVNRPVPMAPADTGQLFRCSLPGDNLGILQDLRYHIEAGDARSAEYRLSVRHIPTIVVHSVQYDYPAYTRREPRVVVGEGEVYAIEGTRVTVHAQANYPIKTATLEFDPAGPVASSHAMKPAGHKASHSFRLLWNDDREGSQHASYRLSFKTEDNRDSDLSVEHKISVSRDLPPDIAILTPKRKEMELPVNSVQRIEIRALDPDFGLTRVVLQAVAGGKSLFDETLMTDVQGQTGQNVLNYDFSPSKFDLSPGDKVTYWAIAEDNRTSPQDDSPQPNSARTDPYVITIVPADPATGGSPQPPSDEAQANDAQQDSAQESAASGSPQEPTPATPQQSDQQPPNEGQEDDQGADSPSADQAPQNNQDGSTQQESPPQQSGNQDDQSAGDQSDSQQSAAASQGSEGATGEQQTGQPQGAQQGEETQGSQTGSGGEQPENGQQGEAAGQMQSGSQSGDSGSSPTGDSQQSAAGGSQAGDQAGQQAQPSENQSGGSGGSDSGGQSSGGEPAPDQSDSGQQSGREEPLHDGDVIERVMRHLEKTGNGGKSAEQDPSSQQPPAGENPRRPEPAATADQNASQSGDQPRQDDAAGTESSPQQSAGDSPSTGTDPAPPTDRQGDSTGGSSPAADDASDPPGKKTPDSNIAGQGDNSDPQQGAGEQPLGPKPPKSVEGSEKSTKPSSEPAEKETGLGDEGDAGSGQSSDDSDGAAGSKEANRDRDKPNQDANRQPTTEQSAQGSSKSQNQSDSQSDDPGERSGGGQQGGGQPANQPGRDSPGSNVSSEQGNTGSPESGEGETADRGGDKQPSPDPTGQSGQQPGSGSDSAAAPSGQQQGPDGASPQTPPTPAAADGNQDQTAQDQQSPNKSTTPGSGSGPPQGGGVPSDGTSAGSSEPKEVPDGDEANLEYARKATDLVLQRLKDQQHEPDPELLKSLGWTKEDLQQFIARWEALKRSAHEESVDSRTELDDALRSLGLRRTALDRRESQDDKDQIRGMRDSGDRSRPPAEFMEQFNAYKKGAARGQTDGG